MVLVVYAAVEFFDAVDYILGHFEMNFPSFEETLRMKHVWQADEAKWTWYARLLHLQTQFKAGWDDELCFHGRSTLFQATYKKLDEIASWNLKTVDDAIVVEKEADAHVEELKETVSREVQGIKRMPDDADANARQVLENAPSFLLEDVLLITTTTTTNENAAAAIVKKLEKRKRTISDEITKVQGAIRDLGQIREAREEVARFFATREASKKPLIIQTTQTLSFPDYKVGVLSDPCDAYGHNPKVYFGDDGVALGYSPTSPPWGD